MGWEVEVATAPPRGGSSEGSGARACSKRVCGGWNRSRKFPARNFGWGRGLPVQQTPAVGAGRGRTRGGCRFRSRVRRRCGNRRPPRAPRSVAAGRHGPGGPFSAAPAESRPPVRRGGPARRGRPGDVSAWCLPDCLRGGCRLSNSAPAGSGAARNRRRNSDRRSAAGAPRTSRRTCIRRNRCAPRSKPAAARDRNFRRWVEARASAHADAPAARCPPCKRPAATQCTPASAASVPPALAANVRITNKETRNRGRKLRHPLNSCS